MIRLKHHSNKSKTVSVRTAKPSRTTCTQNNEDFTHFIHFALGTDLSVRTAKPLRTTCTPNTGDFTHCLSYIHLDLPERWLTGIGDGFVI